MQRKLFWQPLPRPRNLKLQQLQDKLFQYKVMRRFNIQLIGSMLNNPRRAKDIDLLLLPKSTTKISVKNIEDALVAISRVGMALNVSLDGCFRNTRDDAIAGKLYPNQLITTWMLEDPIITLLIKMGLFGRYRRVGKYLIVTKRRAKKFDYFRKLKDGPNGSKLLPPGIPLGEVE